MALKELGMKLARIVYGDREKLDDIAQSDFLNALKSCDSLRAPEIIKANRKGIVTSSRVNTIIKVLVANDAPDSWFEEAEDSLH